MSFLTINGVRLPVDTTSFDEQERLVGMVAFAQSGAMRKSRQTLKKDIAFETPPLLQEEARAWELMLTGEGDFWDFTSYYTRKGSSVILTAASLVAGALHIPAAGALGFGLLNYAFTDATTWTIFVRRFIDNNFDGDYIIRSDGAKWVDGVRNDAAVTTWLTANTAFAVLAGQIGVSPTDDVQYMMAWAFPYLIPETWIEGGMYDNYNIWGGLPYAPVLRVEGTAITRGIPFTIRHCLGQVTRSSAIRGVVDGTLHKNLRRMNVTLKEV